MSYALVILNSIKISLKMLLYKIREIKIDRNISFIEENMQIFTLKIIKCSGKTWLNMKKNMC